MNIGETILIFALIPAAIYGVIALLTLRSKLTGTPRYRPGQAWEHPPMWWSGNPDGIGTVHDTHSGAPVEDKDASGNVSVTAAGGARGSW